MTTKSNSNVEKCSEDECTREAGHSGFHFADSNVEVEVVATAIVSKYKNYEMKGHKCYQLCEDITKALTKAKEEHSKALANAIMHAAHEVQTRDETQYPKITTHALAGILKDLTPDFNYHAYRDGIAKEAREWERERIKAIFVKDHLTSQEFFDRKTFVNIPEDQS